MLTLATSFTSPPAGAEDDGALWIALGDAGFPATHLRVTTNVVKEGKGKNKRERYVCKGSLHPGKRRFRGTCTNPNSSKKYPQATISSTETRFKKLHRPQGGHVTMPVFIARLILI